MTNLSNSELKKQLVLVPIELQPYAYGRYKAFNPNLTESVYKHLRQNSAEWKILCGLAVYTHWGCEILKEVWWLKNNDGYKKTDFYKDRFVPENYLKLNTW